MSLEKGIPWQYGCLDQNLDNKLQLMELVITMAYQAKCNYEDVFGSVRYWDLLIFNFLRKSHFKFLRD